MQNVISSRFFGDIWKLYIMIGVRPPNIPMFKWYSFKDDITEFYLMIDKIVTVGIDKKEIRSKLNENGHLINIIYTKICNKYRFENVPQKLVFSKNTMLKLDFYDSDKGILFIKLPDSEFWYLVVSRKNPRHYFCLYILSNASKFP